MGEAVHVWGQGVYRKSVTSVEYSSEPKVALKSIKKNFFNKIKKPDEQQANTFLPNFMV